MKTNLTQGGELELSEQRKQRSKIFQMKKNKQDTSKRSRIKIVLSISITMEARRKWNNGFNVLKKMYSNPECYSQHPANQPIKDRAECSKKCNFKAYLPWIISQEALGDRLHRNKGVNQMVMKNDLRTAAVTRQRGI